MTGKIPQDFIDDLVARVDIVDVVDSRVPLKKAGKEYKACCPFHDEKTPSFTVSQQKQFYHCFGCGAHGTVIGFLMEYERLSFVEAIKDLANRLGIEVPREGEKDAKGPVRRPVDNNHYALLEKVSQYYRHQLKHHPDRQTAIDYLKNRGLTGEIAVEFELGFSPEGWNNLESALGGGASVRQSLLETGMMIQKDNGACYDRFRDRIMFPIRDRRGRIIGFGGRVLGEGTPKYLNSPETVLFHKGKELYGLYQARQTQRELDSILVVEGYMDVVSLAQHGIRNAVATLGTAITDQHIHELVRHTNEIVFCFDGDRAGKQAAWRALETVLPEVRDGLQVRFMFLPDGEDPDSMVRKTGKTAFETNIYNSMPLAEFMYETLLNKADIRRLDGRARLVDIAKPLVLRLKDSAFRTLLLERIATGAQLEASELRHQYGIQASTRLAGGKTSATFTREKKDVASIVRKAIVLLLNRPSLVSSVGDISTLAEVRVPGTALLAEMLEFLQVRPNVSTAVLIEHYRDRKEAALLAKLAGQETYLHEEQMDKEFKDTLVQLENQGSEYELDQLLQKSQYTELDKREKDELRELLMKRNAPTSA